MDTNNPFSEQAPAKPSSTLNVLTILSMIGSVAGLIQAVYGYFTAQKNYDDMVRLKNDPNMQDAPGFVKSMFSEEKLQMLLRTVEYRLPMMAIGIIASALCFWGAMQMRQLRRQGYTLWLTGELLPLGASLALLGAASASGFFLVVYLFPLVFIILYTIHRKELIH